MAKSPIESALYRALVRVCPDRGLHVSDFVATRVSMQIEEHGRGPRLVGRPKRSDEPCDAQWKYEEHCPDGDTIGYASLGSSVHVVGYRADLVLSLSLEGDLYRYAPIPAESIVLVECDGHEWHERTPQQAARDRARDREILLKTGLPVVRFTGSEIVRDPDGCAAEVVDLAIACWKRAVSASESHAAYAVHHRKHDEDMEELDGQDVR